MQDLLHRALAATPTSMGAFDYLKDPLQINDMRALLRVYDLIPLLAQTVLDEMVDRLQEGQQNLFKNAIKKDYNRLSTWLSESSRNTISRYKKDEQEAGYTTVVGEYHLQMKILDDLSRHVLPYISKDTRKTWASKKEFYDLMSNGRIKAFIKRYISMLSILESIMSVEDIISYKKAVIDKAIPMGQLHEGQEFMFPYAEHAMDDGQIFTYLGLAEYPIPEDDKNTNIVCHYRKLSDSISVVYTENNCLRAVIPFD